MLLKLIFSFYHLLHVFCLPLFVILIGFKKDTSTAADLSIIYSIIFLCFFTLNGNTRHYLLNSNDKKLSNNLIFFRIISYLPLFIITSIICKILLDINFFNLLLIVFIGSLYWLNEIFISKQETENKYFLTVLFLSIYAFAFILFSYSDFIAIHKIFIFSIVILINIFILFIIINDIKLEFNYLDFKQSINQQIVPQIGGTFVIGISSFLFKQIVLFFLSKNVSGTIFIAFTLSGVLLTAFTYGLGPTIFLNKKNNQNLKITFGLLTVIMFFFGISVIMLQYYDFIIYTFIDNQAVFVYCFVLSILGLPLSIIGQYYKLKVIGQNLDLKIYKYDIIPHFTVLILLCLCLFFLEPYFAGLTTIYAGIVTMLIYVMLSKKLGCY